MELAIKKEKISKTILTICLIIFACIQLYPFVWLVLFSFKSNAEIFGENIIGFPKKLLWGNYYNVIYNGKVLNYFFNSMIVTGITILLSLTVSSMAAYAIARMKWKLSYTAMVLFLLGLMIPIHATLLPLFLLFSKLGMLNSYQCLILPYTAFSMPMAIYILTGFMKFIPSTMEESAYLDGCGVFRAFYSIILPMVKPALATVAILTYLFSWNELMFAVTFISKPAYRTLTVGIRSLVGQYYTEWGAIGAGLVVSVIPTLIMYTLMSKQVQNSLITGAVKG